MISWPASISSRAAWMMPVTLEPVNGNGPDCSVALGAGPLAAALGIVTVGACDATCGVVPPVPPDVVAGPWEL